MKFYIFITFISKLLYWFLGDINNQLYVLITYMLLDYLVNVFCVIIKAKPIEAINLSAIFRKISILIIVGSVHLLETYIIKSNIFLRSFTLQIYSTQQFFSLLNNINCLGLPVVKRLSNKLKYLLYTFFL